MSLFASGKNAFGDKEIIAEGLGYTPDELNARNRLMAAVRHHRCSQTELPQDTPSFAEQAVTVFEIAARLCNHSKDVGDSFKKAYEDFHFAATDLRARGLIMDMPVEVSNFIMIREASRFVQEKHKLKPTKVLPDAVGNPTFVQTVNSLSTLYTTRHDGTYKKILGERFVYKRLGQPDPMNYLRDKGYPVKFIPEEQKKLAKQEIENILRDNDYARDLGIDINGNRYGKKVVEKNIDAASLVRTQGLEAGTAVPVVLEKKVEEDLEQGHREYQYQYRAYKNKSPVVFRSIKLQKQNVSKVTLMPFGLATLKAVREAQVLLNDQTVLNDDGKTTSGLFKDNCNMYFNAARDLEKTKGHKSRREDLNLAALRRAIHATQKPEPADGEVQNKKGYVSPPDQYFDKNNRLTNFFFNASLLSPYQKDEQLWAGLVAQRAMAAIKSNDPLAGIETFAKIMTPELKA